MGVSLEYARGMVSGLYPAVSWKARVNRMPANQVLAIYHQAKERGKFSKKLVKQTTEDNHQIDIFEYMEGQRLNDDAC